MRIIPVMIKQLKINLQVKSDPLIYRKLTKAAKISKYPIQLLPSPLAQFPLARRMLVLCFNVLWRCALTCVGFLGLLHQMAVISLLKDSSEINAGGRCFGFLTIKKWMPPMRICQIWVPLLRIDKIWVSPYIINKNNF